MVTWKTYEATQAFDQARKKAFVRLAKAAIWGSKKGASYSGILSKEEFTARIDDIEMLDIEGSKIRLPALPASQKTIWLKEYEEFGRVEGCNEPFSMRLESGRLILEGGIPELRRLELQRAFGETYIVATMSAGCERECGIIEYPNRVEEKSCPERAAS